MKIGLVCPYNMWRGGGVQECVLAMREELAKRGHEVKIITPKPRKYTGSVADYIILLGKSTDIRALATSNEISGTIDAEAVIDTLNKEKFDILHFHEPLIPFLSRQVLSRSTTVNVATLHAKLPETIMTRTIEKVITPYTRSIIKYLDNLTAVSDTAAEYIRTLTTKEVKIIPNGIDLEKYQPRKTTKDISKKTILFIGRLEKRKGLKYLIKAYAKLAKDDKNINLSIAGSGPDNAKLKDWVKLHKVPRVKFLGYVTDERKYELFNEAHLFCSPALYGESFGIVLLEAMAMGVVTVAGNNQGYSAVMQGRGQISIVDPKNIDFLAAKLHQLLYDVPLRANWEKWAKDYVKQFDYKNVVDQYEDLYKTALETKPKSI